mgnify:CR=1 FL=1
MSKKSEDKNGSTLKGILLTLLVVFAACGVYFVFNVFKGMVG